MIDINKLEIFNLSIGIEFKIFLLITIIQLMHETDHSAWTKKLIS